MAPLRREAKEQNVGSRRGNACEKSDSHVWSCRYGGPSGQFKPRRAVLFQGTCGTTWDLYAAGREASHTDPEADMGSFLETVYLIVGPLRAA